MERAKHNKIECENMLEANGNQGIVFAKFKHLLRKAAARAVDAACTGVPMVQIERAVSIERNGFSPADARKRVREYVGPPVARPRDSFPDDGPSAATQN